MLSVSEESDFQLPETHRSTKLILSKPDYHPEQLSRLKALKL
jgi:hypothetical protein